MSDADWTSAGLWAAVVASGLYHGLNPAMGWPLAVSAGLLERSSRALLLALVYLTAGHLLAMMAAIFPFALLSALVTWQRSIGIGASLLVLGFGLYLFARRRHPRALARIPPTQLMLWSFAIAMAHGAGLMLVPIYLGLSADHTGHHHGGAMIDASLSLGVLVSIVHTVAMFAAGGLLACLVYRYLGLKFLSQSWFNLDAVWAGSLVLVGGIALVFNIAALN